MTRITADELREFERRLSAEGKLIEAGWFGFRLAAINSEAPENQVTEMRMAFFAGATHLFMAMIRVMDEGTEATAADEQRIANIHKEILVFVTDFEKRYKIKPRDLNS